jgi:hypothetical protein
MTKSTNSRTVTQEIKKLTQQVNVLQAELTKTLAITGVDEYVTVKRGKNQARFERKKTKDEPDVGVGHYFMALDMTAKKQVVFVPLSIASGKKPAGFSYQIEGTGESAIARADVFVRGDEVTQVTIGTIVYAKIPVGSTATFRLQATMRGKIGKTYRLIIYRINYKLAVTDARYRQYQKEIHSDSLKFS